METADEDRLAAALEHGTTVLHANASTMTNSDSCHDWTGDLLNIYPPPLTSFSRDRFCYYDYFYVMLE